MILSSHSAKRWMVAVLSAVAAFAFVAVTNRSAADEPPAMRRLTEAQYRHSVSDIFGEGVKIGGRFEPDLRLDGLFAVGSGQVGISPSGLEQYDQIARAIADQVLAPERRDALMPCQPAATGFDRKCAERFLATVGGRLYRRPVHAPELKRLTNLAESSAKLLGGFYPGLKSALAVMLVSPSFLYRIDYTGDDPTKLDGYSKATRLSYFLLDTTPDAELLKAAERGELDTPAGYQKQVDRLLASPQLERGVRAFFWDMLQLDKFETLSKDSEIYPTFSNKIAVAAEEQTLKTVIDHLLTRNEDYRSLFTTRRTWMNRPLGLIYQVPVRSSNGWEPYEFPESADRAGWVTDFSFLALHSHPGRSSPTLRGKAIREIFMCQAVPPPPPDVDFTVVQDTTNAVLRTARERLTEHSTNPVCKGCHKVTDGIGLALERFDGAAMFRATENGVPINMDGEVDGVTYSSAIGLGKALAANPEVPGCLVQTMFRYALGRNIGQPEEQSLAQLVSRFESDGYRLRDLMRRVVLSDAFQMVSIPPLEGKTQTAAVAAVDLHRRQFSRKD